MEIAKEQQVSPLRQWANEILGGDVVEWAQGRLEEGVSMRLVVRELREMTGGRIDITEQGLRRWVKK